MKMAVVGTGYVGLLLAVSLSQYNEVIALDIIQEKVDLINQKMPPIHDNIQEFATNKPLNLTATLDNELAYKNAELVVIANPIDYDAETNYFNTCSIEAVITDVILINSHTTMIIKLAAPSWIC